jgi:hypothetical protein
VLQRLAGYLNYWLQELVKAADAAGPGERKRSNDPSAT